MVGEQFGKVAALVLAKRSQGWVGHVVVCSAQVVVALGVADEVDCCRHLEAASGDGLAMRCGTCGTACSSIGQRDSCFEVAKIGCLWKLQGSS